jgi:hypothetical protein
MTRHANPGTRLRPIFRKARTPLIPNETNACVICGKPIFPKAKKCTHCNSFQKIKDKFIYEFNLSGLLSLIPIVTICAGFLFDRIERTHSDLSFFALSCKNMTFSVAVQNRGNRPAVLAEPHLTVDLPPGHHAPRFTVDYVQDDTRTDRFIIESGAAKLFTIQANGNTHNLPCDYLLRLSYVDFNASGKSTSPALHYGVGVAAGSDCPCT